MSHIPRDSFMSQSDASLPESGIHQEHASPTSQENPCPRETREGSGRTKKPHADGLQESDSSADSVHADPPGRSVRLSADELSENATLIQIGIARAFRKLRKNESPLPVAHNAGELQRMRKGCSLPISMFDEVLHEVPEVIFLGPPVSHTLQERRAKRIDAESP